MKLKNINIEYEDGTSRKIDAASLATRVYGSLAEAGLCEPPAQIGAAEKYLILEWRDGWKEVLAVNSKAAELIRYYVIRRIEESGRIALDVGADYPRLIIVNRIPKELERMSIVGDDGVKTYTLAPEIEAYEGIFEAGGKKEFRKYDRANPKYRESASDAPDNLTEIKDSIRAAAQKRGFQAGSILKLEEKQRLQEYGEIAAACGLTGFEKQSDVYGFIELVLRNSNSSAK